MCFTTATTPSIYYTFFLSVYAGVPHYSTSLLLLHLTTPLLHLYYTLLHLLHRVSSRGGVAIFRRLRGGIACQLPRGH